MQYLIAAMIFAGSALMVYNVIKYILFIRNDYQLERQSVKRGIVFIPLFLLIFFLIGYVGVGLSGIADLLIASILLGGSIFVFLLLLVMFRIIAHIRDTEKLLAAQYDTLKNEIDSMTKDALSVLRVNLTKDHVEERRGSNLYDSDLTHDKYSDLLDARFSNLMNSGTDAVRRDLFHRDRLLQHFQEGSSTVSETLLVRMSDGTPAFVRIEATMTKKPVSGDVEAFIVERPYDSEVVRQALLEKVLLDQYDRIAYINNGTYHLISSIAGKKEGMLLNDNDTDSYESIYLNHILPAMDKAYLPAPGTPNPLRLSYVEQQLKKNGVYHVNVPFIIDGSRRFKHFTFYLIDVKANFYLMLLRDSAGPDEERPVAEPVTELPVETPVPPLVEEPLPVQPKEEEDAPVPHCRILVVDDNEINREIASLLLTSEGHEVDLAENGKEAVDMVSGAAPGTYDLVLMDVQMPVMNGFEATRAIRALYDPEKAGVLILATSANTYIEDQKAILDSGMNGYVSKPIQPTEIRDALRKAKAKEEAHE